MEEARGLTVVVVPFPAQGHLNQLLHFSLRLSSHGVAVHYAGSASHNRQAKERLHGWNATAFQNIHFHDLPLPLFPTPPPDPNAAIKFPNHLIPSFEASMQLQAPLASLLRSLSATSRRLVVVHDPLMYFAGHEAASLPNAESYRFQCVPTFIELFYFLHDLPNRAKPRREVLDVIQPPFEGSVTREFWEFISQHHFDEDVEAGTLFNTCRSIEGEFIDLLAEVPRYRNKKIFAVGPLNPVAVKSDGGSLHRPECLEWLDKQPRASVVYVSFGTTSTITDEQIEQLAIGLQCSGQRFIWVLRDADRGDIFADSEKSQQRERKLPPGFERKAEGVGIVVRGWTPQLVILAHLSTGGFMSHCGWNSCMESLSMGVPIIAWPMHSDQPRNAVMVTEYLKVGVTVREWARHEEVVSSSDIEESIKRVMVYDEGKEMRKRADALGEAIRLAISEGGSSRVDFDSFINHITR